MYSNNGQTNERVQEFSLVNRYIIRLKTNIHIQIEDPRQVDVSV